MLLRRQFLAASLMAIATRARAEADPWAALKAGTALVLMRHALAPGTGDPAGFRLGDCSTQRNLSDEGRAQATRIGDLFRENGITEARVFTSQWCRCRDTASLLGLGPVEEQSLLNSFFGKPSDGKPQTEALAAWINTLPQGKPAILVTHQVNITGLTDVVPQSGELVFVATSAGEASRVIGRRKTGV